MSKPRKKKATSKIQRKKSVITATERTENNTIREFLVSRDFRERLQFEDAIIYTDKGEVSSEIDRARQLASKINKSFTGVKNLNDYAYGGEINAIILTNQIQHYLVRDLAKLESSNAVKGLASNLETKFGGSVLDRLLISVIKQFPPKSWESLSVPTSRTQQSELLAEMFFLGLENQNHAFLKYLELFDDHPLYPSDNYSEIVETINEKIGNIQVSKDERKSLLEMFLEPIKASPSSIRGQLEYIASKWSRVLGPFYLKILIAIDILKEEEKSRHFFGPGPGPSEVLKYDTLGPSGAQFSPDQDWMPRVVLIAKSVYVWLDQLSRKYKRNIEKLDSIPDEELEQLASWGFTGLWLIGLWERSKASKRIKQLCGNPEAVASAYSVFDYSINSDLGGNQAFFDLKKRAWDRGIRLAGDMVPNHMGIDSRWIIDHPEWFLSLESLPYPSYSFSGPDLSWDPRIGIYLEDHYFNRTDAAVVFKRVDRESGTAKFVYHGNDGTSMPWNDTAQLNYLQANVREVVIQTIIKVAQMFPIIRFDAAMVLARKHIQRLWFPEPGHGGAIPSRAEHSTSQASFEALMPKEFWREVVDRVAREAPDTLLLAEAFWLLEGYFVRTLGMHRVYNSAFMNMLKEEDNANFRLSIKNTLSFDPEILKRFVNFMNNPDEETAVKQFGKDDKYFGICILLVTLPGLPMFGHGQIEGLTEKYGHEYRRAYVSEEIDSGLLMYHRRLIFPLMKKRYLFAGANFFRLYTLYSDSGGTEESVIAFSNRYNEERALIVINNSNKAISGWINSSEAYLKKEAFSDSGNLSSETLDQCLGLPSDANVFIILRDHVKDLWYIRSAKGIHDSGLHFILGPYGHQVFVDFRKQLDGDRRMLSRLCDKLQGQGVVDITKELRLMELEPLHEAFRSILHSSELLTLHETIIRGETGDSVREDFKRLRSYIDSAISIIDPKKASAISPADIFSEISGYLNSYATVIHLGREDASKFRPIADFLIGPSQGWKIVVLWILIHPFGKAIMSVSAGWFDEWLMQDLLEGLFSHMGGAKELVTVSPLLVKNLDIFSDRVQFSTRDDSRGYKEVLTFFKEPESRTFLQVHQYSNEYWFNKERFDLFIKYLLAVVVIRQLRYKGFEKGPENDYYSMAQGVNFWSMKAEESNYNVEKFLKLLSMEHSR